MGRKLVLGGLFGMLLSMAAAQAFAQGEPAAVAGASSNQWVLITSRFSIALAAAACAYAQSRAITAACESVARNPGATDTIRLFAIMGLAFIEFLAFLTMVVIVMKW
jgi:F-type H+-transporting ATPase subunit c